MIIKNFWIYSILLVLIVQAYAFTELKKNSIYQDYIKIYLFIVQAVLSI